MSRNIKEIGKELLGKSLNSYHRRTGLTQLEKNNEMQDGILDGILSQVDDAYIEKTEQSNVIHLEGSGDGAVVLDSIEGNTLVNLLNFNDIRKGGENYNCLSINSDNKSLSLNSNLEFNNRYQYFRVSNITLHSNKEYTFVCNITKNTFSKTFEIVPYSSRHTNRKGTNGNSSHYLKVGQTGIHKYTFTMVENDIFNIMYADSNAHFNSGEVEIINPMILEGDWTDKEIPPYFEGLQSSFEEKVNDEGKYEIEILSNNKNLINPNTITNGSYSSSTVEENNWSPYLKTDFIRIKPNTIYTSNTPYYNGVKINGTDVRYGFYDANKNLLSTRLNYTITTPSNACFLKVSHRTNLPDIEKIDPKLVSNWYLSVGEFSTEFIPHKYNKIKLLLNSPLLKGDKLVVKDGKLCHYHKMKKIILNGSDSENWTFAPSQNTDNTTLFYIRMLDAKSRREVLCDKFGQRRKDHDLWASSTETDYEAMFINQNRDILTRINTSKLISVSMSGFKQWLKTNNVTVIYELEEPYYEEVLNEYGEPILLEGYENGTIYIDSTIVPTTTVRYTPKMKSFKTLKEVNNDNIMLTNDINDNIIPYLMDIDLMIMEKEMALPSQINIRTIGVKDMTSMQKRTQDMLERLIKGKTLTEQECKTRVTTYLNAGKITDAQAEELNFLIDEIYA